MSIIVQKLASMFKKPIIAWVSALIFTATGLFLGMSPKEVKDASCAAQVSEQKDAVPTEAK